MKQERYAPRPHFFNLSDRMELVARRFSVPGSPWGGAGELQSRLQQPCLPVSLWLAASGPEVVMLHRFQPMEHHVNEAALAVR